MPRCYDCKTDHPPEAFYPGSCGGRRPGGRCKECCKAHQRKYRAQLKATGKQQVRDKAYNLKYHFGITIEEYNRLFAEQGCKCPGCGATENGVKDRAMPVDHDHATGEIRGILCTACNQALGHVYDNIERLEGLAAYLRRHQLKQAAKSMRLIA